MRRNGAETQAFLQASKLRRTRYRKVNGLVCLWVNGMGVPANAGALEAWGWIACKCTGFLGFLVMKVPYKSPDMDYLKSQI
jgi:hypothetical protein